MPIEQVDNQGNVLYLHADQLGSTRVLTDSTGTVVGTHTYDAYGNTTAKTGTATTAFQFAGEYQDSETGAYYLRARYYDPGTGQFLSRDPLAFLTRSVYGFTDGNPLNAIDPSGLVRIAPADPRANCGGTDNQCLSTAGGLFGGYLVNVSCLNGPMGAQIVIATVYTPAGPRWVATVAFAKHKKGDDGGKKDRLRSSDAIKGERRLIRYLSRGMSEKQAEEFQRLIETTKAGESRGGDDNLGIKRLRQLASQVLRGEGH